MAALGIITLVLTGFMIVYYCYIANHTEEHDVSFFISVGLISMVMNLFTNASAFFGIAWLYLGVALVFLGVGWLIDLEDSIGFYTSIGPWFESTFTNTALIGWQILSFVIFPAGAVLYFVNYNGNNALAKACGRAAWFGCLCVLLLLWAVLGIVL